MGRSAGVRSQATGRRRWSERLIFPLKSLIPPRWLLTPEKTRYHDVVGNGIESNGAQHLLIDADDTLWENNIYFERAIANFISFLNHHEYSPEQVREVLNEVERECILKHGYGLHSFAHALVDTFERLAVEPLTPALDATINGFAHSIAEHPVEIIPGVPETLAYLAKRHNLILMTKGAIAEQTGKIERSGLKEYFSSVEVVAEKDVTTYREIAAKYDLPSDSSWMVGNSPKSDINPALAAGMNAVFVPHGNTWVLEHEEIASAEAPARLLIVEKFAELRKHF
ncbi:MAG: haloacid dehalogenase [Acidobacteria bacterium]|nr:MAG: haloacid dehalogenase [Acidobacteriota bacterium]